MEAGSGGAAIGAAIGIAISLFVSYLIIRAAVRAGVKWAIRDTLADPATRLQILDLVPSALRRSGGVFTLASSQ